MTNKRKSQHKPATMRDVARLAGVSQPTVSRVLNNRNSTPVSDKTRQRVLAAAQALKYRPNDIARSLRTRRTHTIALLIADISNGFYHPLARAVQDVARLHNYEVFISNSDHLYANEKLFCEVVSRRSVDGVIMVPIHLTTEELAQFLAETDIPITVLGEQIDHPMIDVVFANDKQATYEATCWMIAERGYTSLGFIGARDDLPPGPRRLEGFERALKEFGVTLDPRFLLKGDFTLESGVEAAHALLSVGDLPRALFVVNDLMAIGVILTLQEAGYRIPDDIAVMGFDDIPEAKMIRPKLTTIAQNPRDMGQKLAEALFERIESSTIIPRRILESPLHLIVRDSA
jgi:DNA-binding LacI/PurR family transcriptional regulator